jgi:hypothetical protein
MDIVSMVGSCGDAWQPTIKPEVGCKHGQQGPSPPAGQPGVIPREKQSVRCYGYRCSIRLGL